MQERLKRLIALRKQAADELEKLFAQRAAITDLVKEEAREDLSADEDTEFRAKTAEIARKQGEIESFDERITELSAEIERSGKLSESAAVARKATARVQEVREKEVYLRGNGNSYFKDLVLSQRDMDPTGACRERLNRHAVDVRTNDEYRALDTTDGNGGYFVPPLHLVEKYAPLARAGRVYANLVQSQPLPAGTNSINFPRMKSGTSTGIQAAENTAVASADPDEDEIEARVRTIAGDTDVSLQLLEQSPINYDEVIFQDLFADYAMKLDIQTLRGTGAAGQMLGVHATPGIGTIAIAGGVTLAKFYAAVADAIQRVHTGRLQAAQHIAMHPRRWGWLTAQLDTTQRPVVVPTAQNPQNSVAVFDQVTPEGYVGSMQGLSVALDPNIGTTYGAGNDEDVVYVQRSSDILLYESAIRSRVLNEIGGKNLTVTLQVYGFGAFTAERYPTSIVEIGGLTAPVFV